MITRILAHVRKELLLLARDRGGLALLYLMPVALVMIMAVVQDAPFRDFSEKQVHVVFKDLDGKGDVYKRQLPKSIRPWTQVLLNRASKLIYLAGRKPAFRHPDVYKRQLPARFRCHRLPPCPPPSRLPPSQMLLLLFLRTGREVFQGH